MRVLFYDIETAPIIAAVWGLYDQNIPYHHVVQDWHIICAAWKWEGGEIESIAAKGKDDKTVVKKLHGLFHSADVVVAHNGDNFDYKKLMARVIQYGLDPLPPVTMVDTLKQSRKVGFTSRKLGDLGKILNTGNKLETERGLWVLAAQGDKKAIKALEVYCRGDIPPLEKLYYKLRPYAIGGPNRGLFSDRPCCPKCGAENMMARGKAMTRSGKYQRWQCDDCGSWTQTARKEKGVKFK